MSLPKICTSAVVECLNDLATTAKQTDKAHRCCWLEFYYQQRRIIFLNASLYAT